MTEYQKYLTLHEENLRQLKSRSKLYSVLRLVVALVIIGCFYYYTQTTHIFLLVGLLISVSLFILLLRRHQKVEWKLKIEESLIKIYSEEIDHLDNGSLPFYNGLEFTHTNHSYSFDLDVFGNNSLFQYLNRTETLNGKKELAHLLNHFRAKEAILQNQEAIKELTNELEWRNKVRVLARTKPDDEKSHHALIQWLGKRSDNMPILLKILSRITPLIVLPSLIIYFISNNALFWQIAGIFFIVNLLILTTNLLGIKMELIPSVEIDKILLHYGLMLHEIETKNFESQKLVELQNKLIAPKLASQSIHELSQLFARMDHVQNIFASPLLNGLFLYHIHILYRLYQWRKKNATHVAGWLKTLGEIEAVNSLANYSFNNPDFTFPSLNTEMKIEFDELGHPLIDASKRVCNDVRFDKHRFIILTGSNMSGKSTFLRTLGINMLLTNIGAPICSRHADVHALPILVSMRLSDSLSDSESYFFAEVKRLKEIMDQLSETTCFVLLDEILRGTNSDDKRSGTIEVIRKMVALGAIGAIATHDLEVCKTTDEFPDVLTNKRFEVEILNDELSFDYKLRDGVCENKSATFLMEKMGVI